MRLPIAALALCALTVTACSDQKIATLNDVTVNRNGGPKFRVTLVDGNAVSRQSSTFFTVQPFVILSPGPHKITVQRGLTDPPDTRAYELDLVAAEKATYNLILKDDKPEIVPAK